MLDFFLHHYTVFLFTPVGDIWLQEPGRDRNLPEEGFPFTAGFIHLEQTGRHAHYSHIFLFNVPTLDPHRSVLSEHITGPFSFVIHKSFSQLSPDLSRRITTSYSAYTSSFKLFSPYMVVSRHPRVPFFY